VVGVVSCVVAAVVCVSVDVAIIIFVDVAVGRRGLFGHDATVVGIAVGGVVSVSVAFIVVAVVSSICHAGKGRRFVMDGVIAVFSGVLVAVVFGIVAVWVVIVGTVLGFRAVIVAAVIRSLVVVAEVCVVGFMLVFSLIT